MEVCIMAKKKPITAPGRFRIGQSVEVIPTETTCRSFAGRHGVISAPLHRSGIWGAVPRYGVRLADEKATYWFPESALKQADAAADIAQRGFDGESSQLNIKSLEQYKQLLSTCALCGDGA